MCGIFLVKKQELSKDKVYLEFNKSQGRGPDDNKFFEIGEYFLGFHRLSINGLNSQSNQPCCLKSCMKIGV